MKESLTIDTQTRVFHTDMQLHIVGCKYYITDETERKAFLDSAPQSSLIMACEPNNPFDSQAIAVYKLSDCKIRLVAYISRENLEKAHGILEAYGKTWMPIHALGLQPGRHTTLLAYPVDDEGEMIMDAERYETPDTTTGNISIGDINLNFYDSKTAAAALENELPAKNYFESDEFSEGIAKVTDYIKNKNASWAHVYYFLRRHGLDEMPRTRFGEFIHSHGGPSARTVRDSGNFELKSYQLMGERDSINAIGAFFPGI